MFHVVQTCADVLMGVHPHAMMIAVKRDNRHVQRSPAVNADAQRGVTAKRAKTMKVKVKVKAMKVTENRNAHMLPQPLQQLNVQKVLLKLKMKKDVIAKAFTMPIAAQVPVAVAVVDQLSNHLHRRRRGRRTAAVVVVMEAIRPILVYVAAKKDLNEKTAARCYVNLHVFVSNCAVQIYQT